MGLERYRYRPVASQYTGNYDSDQSIHKNILPPDNAIELFFSSRIRQKR